MVGENISQELKLKNIDETISYVVTETEQNKFINKKYKKVCSALNFISYEFSNIITSNIIMSLLRVWQYN